MTAPSINIFEIFRCLIRCLRHSYVSLCAALSSLGQMRTWPAVVLCRSSRDILTMSTPSTVWRKRIQAVASRSLDFLWICIIYLTSELIIWGLSQVFTSAKLEFFSSICGMILVFTLMTSICLCSRTINDHYVKHLKPKVDFINFHLGLGFSIPLVMLGKGQTLGNRAIGRIIGNFAITNLVSWTLTFAFSLLVMAFAPCQSPRPITTTCYRAEAYWPFPRRGSTHIDHEKMLRGATPGLENEHSSAETTQPSSLHEIPCDTGHKSKRWNRLVSLFPLLASFFCIFLVGVPIAATTTEERILDGCVLWFIWVSTCHVQREFNLSHFLSFSQGLKNALVTLMNPVLMTTLLLTAYTRAKASAYAQESLSDVLSIFSGGTPLYAIWTSKVTGSPLPSGASSWFGAGDAALSILECGILVWGFKLYECQRQVFSMAGLLTIFISTLAAAGNVFLSVLSGRSLGLDTPEALSFAARSATLALSKPAIHSIGGNLGVNAALVVSNGIVGQLMYPFVLDRLDVKTEDDTPDATDDSGQDERGCPKAEAARSARGDNPVTIATGIAIGINGAALGVSYLYKTRSRSAPYAALAMTVFGIMTVIFTTVEPFRGVVIGLAGR